LGDIHAVRPGVSHRTAIYFEGKSLTYAELNERVNRLCNALRDLGIGKGDRVAVLSENTYKYLEIYFAAGKLGISVTPLNFRLADPEIIHITDDSESTVFAGGYDEPCIWPQPSRIRQRIAWITGLKAMSL
jgi:fatty-acyl-CoA synthase